MHKWKVHDNFAGGVPDCWYVGPEGNIWVEYKWIKALPKRDTTRIKPNLSAQQLAWLIKMSGHGISCACIIGFPEGGIVLTEKDQWLNGINKIAMSPFPSRDIANWLTECCMEAGFYGNNKRTEGDNGISIEITVPSCAICK
jgi:hypothetical protein